MLIIIQFVTEATSTCEHVWGPIRHPGDDSIYPLHTRMKAISIDNHKSNNLLIATKVKMS